MTNLHNVVHTIQCQEREKTTHRRSNYFYYKVDTLTSNTNIDPPTLNYT